MITSEKKLKGGYDALDAEAKKVWDEKKKASDLKKVARDDLEKTANGFAKMTPEQQTIYMGGLLEWKKVVYKACNADPTSDECKQANALRAK